MTTETIARPKRLTRQEAKAQTRRTLIETAGRMFVRLGYEGANLEAIAAEAGFTKGAVYFHFPSKEALFLELLSAGLTRQITELQGLMELATADPRVLLREFDEWLDRLDLQDDLPLLAIELQLASRRNNNFAASFGDVLAAHQGALAGVLTSYFAIAGRAPPLPVDRLAASLVAISEGLAIARQAQGQNTIASTGEIVRAIIEDRRAS